MRVKALLITSELAEMQANAKLTKPVVFMLTSTHQRFSDGGRKAHLMPLNGANAFCGSRLAFHVEQMVDIDWVKQSDPEGELCKNCQKAAEKFLDAQVPEVWEQEAKEAKQLAQKMLDQAPRGFTDTLTGEFIPNKDF